MRVLTILSALLMSAAFAHEVPLIDPEKPMNGWSFGNGPEFPGAKGSLQLDAEAARDGKPSLRLMADLSGGGNYVQMGRTLDALKLDLDTLSFWLKAPDMTGMTMRLIDGTGQCHQLKLKLDPVSDDWRLISFPVDRFFEKAGTTEAVQGIAQYEHWGGAKDGKWHGQLKAIFFLSGKTPKAKTSSIWISGLVASVRSAAYACDFDDAALPAGWKTEGSVTLDKKDAFKGGGALLLERKQEEMEKPCAATGNSFAVAPGTWEISAAVRSELESPDSSYNGTVTLEVLDAGGARIDHAMIAEPFGKRPWQLAKKRVELPKQAASARFIAKLNKSSGRFWVDELTAAAVNTGRKPAVVNRIVFSTAQSGNLFKPEDPRTFTITVETMRELADAERKLYWVVRDYWGAEQGAGGNFTVEAKGKNKDRFRYEGSVDLAAQPIETGRYYELHASVPLADDEPFRNYVGFSVLPIAPAKAFKPDQIPFTSRNWDNRVTEYVNLTDRLGIRICGIWGGADAQPPHKPHAPQIELCAKLDMAVLTGCPAHLNSIEYHRPGYEKWTEDAIRGAIKSWLAAYGNHTPKPLIVNLGNEPHCTGEHIKEVVRAYKIAYDEIKKIDPSVFVVATSVPATEDYFKAGYQDACDAFDFHVYETPKSVRDSIAEYQELMKKYNCVKPIWSTEIGLNSQGLTRQHIAGDMIRKFAAFFAAGGASISWFDLLYPDPDAKNFGTGGESMNVFDSRYSKYAPRLDAVTLYNLVNGILIKKFASERDWDGGNHGCLFRDVDGKCFALLWRDKGRQDVFLPLAGVRDVQVIRIDGRRSTLNAGEKGVTLTLSEDPLMLAYSGPAELPQKLEEPAVKLAKVPATMVRGVPATIEISGATDPKQVTLITPPDWKVELQDGAARAVVTSPESSTAREGDILVRLTDAAGAVVGELSCRPAVTGRLTVEIRPVPPAAGGKPGARVVVSNYSSTAQTVTWSLALNGERPATNGQYGAVVPTTAFFAEAANGTLTVAAKQQAAVTVPISGFDPIKLYSATAAITDASGGTNSIERFIGGFVAVPRVNAAPKLDGNLDDADWERSPRQQLDQAHQYLTLSKAVQWKGKDDLSATMRYLWDEKCLYVGVQVADDVFSNTKEDGSIWAGDGLQFLVDPSREAAEKPGKYDLGMALGRKGPQAWCFLSANAATSAGAVPDIVVAVARGEGGAAIYEVAIPWTRLAPFTPAAGANLGLSMIVNEDDGRGRTGFIGWFGNPHTKQIDAVGDLILLPE